MSVDPDLRIALGFLFLLRALIGYSYSGPSAGAGILAELERLPGAARLWRRIAWTMLLAPGLLFLILGDHRTFALALLDDLSRCLMLVPALGGLIVTLWSLHSAASRPEQPAGELHSLAWISGPFRAVRHPQWMGDLLLFGSALIAAANGWALLALLIAVSALTWGYFPLADQAWRRLLGDAYPDYAARTGRLLPPLRKRAVSAADCYVVPRRFGIAEILALVTLFAFLFGTINGVQGWAPDFRFAPLLNLFLGTQLLAICLGQMFFGGSPRLVSALIGGLALPLFVCWQVPPRGAQSGLVMGIFLLMLFGAMIGYALGAIAAGLFLGLDWVRPYVPWLRGRNPRHNSLP